MFNNIIVKLYRNTLCKTNGHNKQTNIYVILYERNRSMCGPKGFTTLQLLERFLRYLPWILKQMFHFCRMAAHEDTGPSEAELAMQVCFYFFFDSFKFIWCSSNVLTLYQYHKSILCIFFLACNVPIHS